MTTSKFLGRVAFSLQSQMLICCILYCKLPHTEEQIQKSKQGLPARVKTAQSSRVTTYLSKTHFKQGAKGGQMWTKYTVHLMIPASLDGSERLWLAFRSSYGWDLLRDETFQWNN